MAPGKTSRAGGKRRRGANPSVRSVRKAARPHTRVGVNELYGGGETGNLLQGKFHTKKVHAWFEDRHQRQFKNGVDPDGFYRSDEETRFGEDHEWKVPYGVRLCLEMPLMHGQIVNRFPWAVTWVSPKTGNRLWKKFNTAISAIHFIATMAQYVDPKATLISRLGYDIPADLRGRIPKPYYWCPRCMTARKFRRTYSEATFYGLKKVKVYGEGRRAGEWWYEFKERQLSVIECPVCEGTNRDGKFRRSNQPWEVRRFKRGVTRAKRRP
jgi:hypothetical protein